VDRRIAVDDLPRVRVDEDDVANAGAVGDLHLVDELVRSGDAPDEPHPVDEERRRRRTELTGADASCQSGLLVDGRVGDDGRDRLRACLARGELRRDAQVEVRHDDAVHGGEVVPLVQVRLDGRAVDGNALVLLPVGEVARALTIFGRPGANELARALCAEHGAVLVQELLRLCLRRRRGLARQQVAVLADLDEPRELRRLLGADRDRAARVVLQLLDERRIGPVLALRRGAGRRAGEAGREDERPEKQDEAQETACWLHVNVPPQ
jgi:hypothetical protein